MYCGMSSFRRARPPSGDGRHVCLVVATLARTWKYCGVSLFRRARPPSGDGATKSLATGARMGVLTQVATKFSLLVAARRLGCVAAELLVSQQDFIEIRRHLDLFLTEIFQPSAIGLKRIDQQRDQIPHGYWHYRSHSVR